MKIHIKGSLWPRAFEPNERDMELTTLYSAVLYKICIAPWRYFANSYSLITVLSTVIVQLLKLYKLFCYNTGSFIHCDCLTILQHKFEPVLLQ